MKSSPSKKDGDRGVKGGGGESAIESLINNFNAEDFLSSNKEISKLSLELLKQIYDFTKISENKGSLDDPLGLHTESLKVPILNKVKKKKRRQPTISKAEAPVPELIVKHFDEDQIWEELELQNGLMYENLVTSVSKLLACQEKPMEDEDSEEGDSFEDEDEEEADSQSQLLDRPPGHSQPMEEDEEEDSDFFESDEKHRRKGAKQGKDGKQYRKSVVDDKFFSLAQMTEHIEQVEAEMERVEAKKSGGAKNDGEEESSDEEDSIDLFEDVPSSDEEKGKEESSDYFYQDFFDPPLDGSEPTNEGEEEEDEEVDGEPSFDNSKSVRFNLEEDENEDDQIDEELDEDDDDKSKVSKELGKKISETLSTFERRQKKIEENIAEIEKEAMQPKAWHLLGEATAVNRPENALLEEHLIYDHLLRQAPEITVETTLKLEDVIKQRIKDGAWDDVQRKVKPVEDPREFKKRLVMDAEKSKASLAEVYEQEYLAKKQAEDGEAEEKEPDVHIQIKNEMRALFSKLDELSHHQYTPKPIAADIKIVSNTPAISMEEVAPVSVSDATLLAPQEIEDRIKGPMKGKEERSETDRKRERRKKKKKQHLKRLKQEEKARMKGLGLRNIKLAADIVKSQQKGKNDNADNFSYQNTKELKSSKAFFSKLQESVSSHIKNVTKRKSVAKDSNTLSAKKFKL